MRLEEAQDLFGPTPRCPSCFAPLDARDSEFFPHWDEEGALLFEEICSFCAGKFKEMLGVK